MLSLTTNIEFEGGENAFLLKLELPPDTLKEEQRQFYPDQLRVDEDGNILCQVRGQSLKIFGLEDDSLLGDVLLCQPRVNIAQRLIRRQSDHNTILFTERCDQMCAMCSQPPKDTDYSPMFPFYKDAILLADKGMRIGISGGEPTLYMQELLDILENSTVQRPDISFHILSNGQHFNQKYMERIEALNNNFNLLWGIPLYSHQAAVHDEIVGKLGAFEKVMAGYYQLAEAGASIELRTVLTARNVLDLPLLAKFIATNLPFVSFWAIMAMEPIGFAKANKKQLFYDHSIFPQPLIAAIENSCSFGVDVRLYNFPLCSIPKQQRGHCTASISDWKRKYVEECTLCEQKKHCTGFFEWYDHNWKWKQIRSLDGNGSYMRGI